MRKIAYKNAWFTIQVPFDWRMKRGGGIFSFFEVSKIDATTRKVFYKVICELDGLEFLQGDSIKAHFREWLPVSPFARCKIIASGLIKVGNNTCRWTQIKGKSRFFPGCDLFLVFFIRRGVSDGGQCITCATERKFFDDYKEMFFSIVKSYRFKK